MAASRGQRAPLKTREKVWVASTLSLILFLVFSPQFFLIGPYFFYRLGYETFEEAAWHLARYLVPFNACAALMLINYGLCVGLDPGSVPKSWKPPFLQRKEKKDDEQIEGSEKQVSTKESEPSKRRYCAKCKAYKPPRAHHCKTCRRCVLRMDHHCPWVANCVGYRNYASFLRFLFFVDVCCSMHLVGLSLFTLDYWWVDLGGQWRPPASNGAMVLLVLNFAACVPTLCLVGVFSIYHFYCLFTNSTTIEGWEKDKVATMLRRGRIRGDTRGSDFPFDLGSAIRNAISVFGYSPLTWCWPGVTPGSSDGYTWPVASDLAWEDQFLWPPSDPSKAFTKTSGKAAASMTAEMLKTRDPFTYGGNGFNPALKPSNSETMRQRRTAAEEGATGDALETMATSTSQRATVYETGVSSVSPWHPDFKAHEIESGEEEEDEEAEQQEQSESEEESQINENRVRVRRGSEGYEVRPRQWTIDETAEEGSEEERAASEEGEGYNDEEEEGEDDDERYQWNKGYEEMDREQAWLARQQEEDRLRAILEKEMRERKVPYVQYDPMLEIDGHSQMGGYNGKPLLPSQVMQNRAKWQESQGLSHNLQE